MNLGGVSMDLIYMIGTVVSALLFVYMVAVN